MGYLQTGTSRCDPQESEIHSDDGKGVVHIALNPREDYVRQYLLDGDIFPQDKQPQRCDYLVINDSRKSAYFIELSSFHKIKHVFDQLNQSHGDLRAELGGMTCHFRIVLTTTTTKSSLRGKTIRDWRAQGDNRKVGISPMIESI